MEPHKHPIKGTKQIILHVKFGEFATNKYESALTIDYTISDILRFLIQNVSHKPINEKRYLRFWLKVDVTPQPLSKINVIHISVSVRIEFSK